MVNTSTAANTHHNSDAHSYDFIFSILVIEHLTEAKHQVQRIYQHLLKLKPDGVIFLRDGIMPIVPPQATGKDKIDGWTVPHPAMYPFFQQYIAFMQSKNPGIEVAKDQTE